MHASMLHLDVQFAEVGLQHARDRRSGQFRLSSTHITIFPNSGANNSEYRLVNGGFRMGNDDLQLSCFCRPNASNYRLFAGYFRKFPADGQQLKRSEIRCCVFIASK